MNFNRVALAACRAMWAQFNPLLMAFGLSVLSMGICAAWSLYSGLSCSKDEWEPWLVGCLSAAVQGAVGGAILGAVGYIGLSNLMPGVSAIHTSLFGATLVSSISLIITSPPDISLDTIKSAPIILILHAIAFLSNSFTFWEDRIVPFFLITSIIPNVLVGFSAPNARLRYRILGFSFLFAICVCLILISTICREEQQPYCHVTFFASSSLPSPPLPVLYLAIPVTALLPYIINRFLNITKSNMGLAVTFLPFILAPALLSSSAYWIIEWADSASVLGDEWTSILRLGRTWVARIGFGWLLLAGGTLWALVPLCLNIEVTTEGEKRQVQVLGYPNAFGAPYLLFWSLALSAVYICTQLTRQLVLALASVALIAYLEVLDSVRDAKAIEAAFVTASTPSVVLDPIASTALVPGMKYADIVPVVLLGLHAFYGTGHQSTISSLQWKSAFVLTPTVGYLWSVVMIVLNSVGPFFVFALVVPLVALWNKAPLRSGSAATNTSTGQQNQGTQQHQSGSPQYQVKSETTLAALGIMIYYSALLLGTAVGAAILRRHLMVWKVFTPWFMVAVLELLAVDVAVLLGLLVGVERIVGRVVGLFSRS